MGDKSSQRSDSFSPDQNPFQSLRPAVSNALAAVLPRTGDVGYAYGGPTVADITAAEERGLADLDAFTRGASSLSRDTLNYHIENPNDYADDLLASLGTDISNFIADEELNTRALFQQAGQSDFARSSGYSEAFADVADIGLDAYAKEAAAIRDQGYDRQLSAISALEGLNQGEFNRQIANLEAQALPRMIEDLGIERGIELFQNRQNTLLAALGGGVDATGVDLGNLSESKSSTKNSLLGYII